MDKIIPYAFKLWITAAVSVPVIQSCIHRIFQTRIQGADYLDSWLYYGTSVFFCLVSTGPCLLLFLVSAALVYTQKIHVVNSKFSMLLLSAISVTLGTLIITWGGKLPTNFTWLLVNLFPVFMAIWVMKPLPSEPARIRTSTKKHEV